jgi:hypothetical protein
MWSISLSRAPPDDASALSLAHVASSPASAAFVHHRLSTLSWMRRAGHVLAQELFGDLLAIQELHEPPHVVAKSSLLTWADRALSTRVVISSAGGCTSRGPKAFSSPSWRGSLPTVVRLTHGIVSTSVSSSQPRDRQSHTTLTLRLRLHERVGQRIAHQIAQCYPPVLSSSRPVRFWALVVTM